MNTYQNHTKKLAELQIRKSLIPFISTRHDEGNSGHSLSFFGSHLYNSAYLAQAIPVRVTRYHE